MLAHGLVCPALFIAVTVLYILMDPGQNENTLTLTALYRHWPVLLFLHINFGLDTLTLAVHWLCMAIQHGGSMLSRRVWIQAIQHV